VRNGLFADQKMEPAEVNVNRWAMLSGWPGVVAAGHQVDDPVFDEEA
jgi:hypothetical protein